VDFEFISKKVNIGGAGDNFFLYYRHFEFQRLMINLVKHAFSSTKLENKRAEQVLPGGGSDG
jgi:hypothetical protein